MAPSETRTGLSLCSFRQKTCSELQRHEQERVSFLRLYKLDISLELWFREKETSISPRSEPGTPGIKVVVKSHEMFITCACDSGKWMTKLVQKFKNS
jgi:hypothetical protein